MTNSESSRANLAEETTKPAAVPHWKLQVDHKKLTASDLRENQIKIIEKLTEHLPPPPPKEIGGLCKQA